MLLKKEPNNLFFCYTKTGGADGLPIYALPTTLSVSAKSFSLDFVSQQESVSGKLWKKNKNSAKQLVDSNE